MGDNHSEQVTALMSLALDGLLDAHEQRDLQQHLAGCAACMAEYEAMQQVSAWLGEAPMVGPPLGFAIRVERRLDERARKQRRLFGGLAVVTSSLSLAGITVAAMALIVLGLLAWQGSGGSPALLGDSPALLGASPSLSMQQGTSVLAQVASGMGLVGKGATLFLWDLLQRYGPPLVLLLAVGLAFLVGMWIWLFVKPPGESHRSGYVQS
jgi:anti-sigma factor RsiW